MSWRVSVMARLRESNGARAADRPAGAARREAARARPDAPVLRLRERRPADQRAAGVPRRLGARPDRHRHALPRVSRTCPRASSPSCARRWSTCARWPAWPAACGLGDYVTARQGRGGHRRPGQVLDPRRHARGRDRRRLPRLRPGRGRRAGAPALRPGDRPLGPARRRPGLEDVAAGAHRGRGTRRARVPRRRERARSPEVLPGLGLGRRPDLRRGRRALQEGSRAAGRRGGLDGDHARHDRVESPGASSGGRRRRRVAAWN